MADQAARACTGCPGPAVPGLCRGLVSARTAAWCRAGFGHPELRWHAEHHLSVVKRLMARRQPARRHGRNLDAGSHHAQNIHSGAPPAGGQQAAITAQVGRI